MIEAQATARGIRTSAQKAGLVCELIRGKGVNQALATLQFTRKTIAREIAKVLRSAVANAQQKDGFSGDIERLFVAACYANQGPSMKRVRPAPDGSGVPRHQAHRAPDGPRGRAAVEDCPRGDEEGDAPPGQKPARAAKDRRRRGAARRRRRRTRKATSRKA